MTHTLNTPFYLSLTLSFRTTITLQPVTLNTE